MRDILAEFTALLRSIEFAVKISNALAQEYAIVSGHPEWYEPFTIEDREKVGMSWAGLAALVGAIGDIALLKSHDPTRTTVCPVQWTSALNDIRVDFLTPQEKQFVMRDANIAWRAIQAMRNVSKALGALERPINMAFELLSDEMKELDFRIVQKAAQVICEELRLGHSIRVA